tara:strand:- start:14 stop:193 length:180 start_codon:yes stop_codon:yes gene_type:complete
MTKLQEKMAKLKAETDPKKIIDICCAIFGLTGKSGGEFDGVKNYVGGQMRLAQDKIKNM